MSISSPDFTRVSGSMSMPGYELCFHEFNQDEEGGER